VALLVSGIVLLGARNLLEATADQARRIIGASTAADRDANAERLLRSIVGRVEVGTAPGTEFAGEPEIATFSSWCDVPGGWLERCAVTLAVVRDSVASALVLRTSLGDTIRVRERFRVGAIRYLDSPSAGGSWIRVWGAGITAPIAIGVILDRDTLIVRIGERG